MRTERFAMVIRGRKIRDLSRIPVGELKKHARILVIDDEECSFPFELLRKEGYSIDHWFEIKNLKDLENGLYDIIVLDIKGVAKAYTKDDGLGILEHLKAVNPSQIVVAFSGQSFDLSMNKFWMLADDSLAKPVDVTKCKRLIDELIEKKMTVEHYWQGLMTILKKEGISDKDLRKIEKKLVKALEKRQKSAVDEVLCSFIDKAEILMRLGIIAIKMLELVGPS